MALQAARLVAVLALLCAAAAIATPKGRLPLALRGLEKMLKSCAVEKSNGSSAIQPFNSSAVRPSVRKRLLALALVLFAILLALT